MLDFAPAARPLAEVVVGVRDEQLSAPTSCSDASVGDLIDHVDGLSYAFAAAATKSPLPEGAGQSIDASRLGTDWRERIPKRLDELAAAWRDESGWHGMTKVGPLNFPGEIAAFIALDEVIVHGWDIATASGQSFTAEPQLVEAALAFVQQVAGENPQGTPGLFGPPVAVPEDAPPLDRLLGMTGRDPGWKPAN